MIVEIGGIVRRARETAKLSIEALARDSAVPSSTIADIEAGIPGITRLQLTAVAERLWLEPRALATGREVPHAQPSVYLRHRRDTQDLHEADHDVFDDALSQGRLLRELGELLGEKPTHLEPARRAAPNHKSDAAAKDGYTAAEKLRTHLSRPVEPLDDLAALAESHLGIAVLVRRLNGMTACAIIASDAAAVVLAAHRPSAAVQFEIAHELCHVLVDPLNERVNIVVEPEGAPDVVAASERRANAFAAELNLPKKGLQGLFGLPASVATTDAAINMVCRAMDRYHTSWEVTANHLCNRGFVSRDLREWLEAAHAQPEPAYPNLMLPALGAPSRLVAARVERAHRAGILTDSEARTALKIDTLDPLAWD